MARCRGQINAFSAIIQVFPCFLFPQFLKALKIHTRFSTIFLNKTGATSNDDISVNQLFFIIICSK